MSEPTINHPLSCLGGAVRLEALLHQEPDGGFWCEVPAIPGCISEGDTFAEALFNIGEAADGCLKALRVGTQLALMRQTGITREEL